jgi:glutamate--cysteine ligase catalytic subunit
MTVNEVINGQARSDFIANPGQKRGCLDGEFPGLIPLVESYLNSVNIDIETRCELATYLDLIRKRASGELWTGARWIREFVRNHPKYEKDSVVSDEIQYDLVITVENITLNEGRDGIGVEMLRQNLRT